MQIRCPSCRYHIVVKGAKAGGYRPTCPRCEKPYVMVIAMVEGHRLVLVGDSMETLVPVKSPKPVRELTQSPAADDADEALLAAQQGKQAHARSAAASEAPTAPQSPAQPAQQEDQQDDDFDAAIAAEIGPPADEQDEDDTDRTRTQGPVADQNDDSDQGPIELDIDPDDAESDQTPTLDQFHARTQDQPDSEPATQTQPRTQAPTAAAPKPNPAPNAAQKPAPPKPAPASTPPTPATPALTGRLDGYEIEKPIGEGGMGAVYLARQLSLDREVALKTIKPAWASNPNFLSRFTREAYAAAQLTHHNVVQIYDLGEDQQTHYFSMEYVRGRSLADLLRKQGPLDVEEAAGYILQAARGLKFAHDHGMVHRDIKPANLLINDQGVVKVADLGLVKTAAPDETASADPGSTGDPHATKAAAMGTPAYMAPEQAHDAAHVDGRADIYALGCTFYALTTGRPLFEGNTAEELISKHATAAVIPPERIIQRVPKSISAIIMKMVAKKPDDRYANADELIAALEDFLGISAGPFTPREEHARALEDAVRAFNDSPRAKLRRWLTLGFSLACVALFLFGALTARPSLAAGALTLWLFTGVGYAILTGITQRTFVFRKVRQLVFGSRPREWVSWGLAAALLVVLVVMLGLAVTVIWTAVAGLVLAAAVHFTVDRLVAAERKPHIESVREMLKAMRLRGLEEDALRRFVCKYSGKRWEPFYEALFDYEAKMQARRLWGADDDGKPRKKHATWRDGLIQWIDQKQQQREEARQRKHLQKIEAQRLQAEGKSEQDAAREANQVADSMVETAVAYKQTGKWHNVAKAAEKPAASDKPRTQRRSPITLLLDLLLGGRARFVVGAVLLAAYSLWVRQNNLTAGLSRSPGLRTFRDYLDAPTTAEPLRIPFAPFIPEPPLQLLSTHGVGLAGLLLLLAAFRTGKRMTFAMLPAVAVLLLAPHAPLDALDAVPIVTPYEIILAVGLILGLLALKFARKGENV
ncbi:MAG: serine/threonine-protein kinase [Phycisphaeraceae bacterium]